MKVYFVDKLMLATIGLLVPLADALIAILILITFDWITGVWKSISQGRRFTSYRLRLSISKTVTYFIAIYLASLLDNILICDYDMHLAAIIAAYIGVTELVSIYENISVITGKEFMKDLASMISDKVKTKMK